MRLIDADALRDALLEEDYECHQFCYPCKAILKAIDAAPTVQPEKTEYIPDIKAVRSNRDCVDLAERVTATFYDQEYEEWTQQTVTIADVLDSVCDEYTILPSAQPKRQTGRWEKENWFCNSTMYKYTCSECGAHHRAMYDYCPSCGADMRGEKDG